MTPIERLSPNGEAMARWRKRRPRDSEKSAPGWLEQVAATVESLDLSPACLPLSWEIARLAPAELQTSVHLLALAALRAASQGSTLTPPEVFARSAQELAPPGPEGLTALEGARSLWLDPSRGAPAVLPSGRAPLLIGPHGLAMERLSSLEDGLSQELAERLSTPVSPLAQEDLPLPRTSLFEVLTEEQANAVLAAAGSPVTIITGGPGTGKTSIVAALLGVVEREGMDLDRVALAAPTGKASHRLAQSVRLRRPRGPWPRTETLHRLLGARPGQSRFAYDETHPLPVDLLIVDEASMMDLELATRTLRALPGGARWVLLGDADQLPSVEVGAVLSELIDALPARCVYRLQHSFRMDAGNPEGKAVLEGANRLAQGDGAGFRRLARARSSAVRWTELSPDPSEREAFLEGWMDASPLGDADHLRRVRSVYRLVDGRFSPEDAVEIQALLARASSMQLLTVTRRALFLHGAERVSRDLHRLYARRQTWLDSEAFLPGEPVMVLRNDYERRLFNGDLGVLLRAVPTSGSRAHLHVVFPGPTSGAGTARGMLPGAAAGGPSTGSDGITAFDLEPLRGELTLAHAITVHKAQGSEYDSVTVLLPENDIELATSEMLYTAATRARSHVHLAGSASVLDAALRRKAHRRSELGPKLKKALS